jgi:hypothetical protein
MLTGVELMHVPYRGEKAEQGGRSAGARVILEPLSASTSPAAQTRSLSTSSSKSGLVQSGFLSVNSCNSLPDDF